MLRTASVQYCRRLPHNGRVTTSLVECNAASYNTTTRKATGVFRSQPTLQQASVETSDLCCNHELVGFLCSRELRTWQSKSQSSPSLAGGPNFRSLPPRRLAIVQVYFAPLRFKLPVSCTGTAGATSLPVSLPGCERTVVAGGGAALHTTA